MEKDINSIRKLWEIIKGERSKRANTAERVGSAGLALCDAIDERVLKNYFDKKVAESHPDAVEINGVWWATRNVGAPGTFMETPEMQGMLYQLNRSVGWSATNPMVNSNGGTVWNTSANTMTHFDEENDPSPNGYRLPAREEVLSLIDEPVTPHIQNSIRGFLVGTAPKQVFFRMHNWRDTDGSLITPTTMQPSAHFWTRERTASLVFSGTDWLSGIVTSRTGSPGGNTGLAIRPVLIQPPIDPHTTLTTSVGFEVRNGGTVLVEHYVYFDSKGKIQKGKRLHNLPQSIVASSELALLTNKGNDEATIKLYDDLLERIEKLEGK